LTDAGQRSGRNELVRDAVRAEAVQRKVDLVNATPAQRKELAAFAMQRVQNTPALRDQAMRYGVRYLDYLSEASGGRAETELQASLRALDEALAADRARRGR
jgi:uncharacterized membrane protein YccC